MQAQGSHVLVCKPRLMPFGDARKRCLERPARGPLQTLSRFGDIQFQKIGFVRVLSGLQRPACPVAPILAQMLDNPFYRFGVFVARTKVPAFGICLPLIVKALSQQQVTGQGLKNVLPRADRVGVADKHRLVLL